MRVHRLEITAFGPFPATEVVEFDALNDAGIFLLTGPTGAGKTTILDAICFGLFGAVPGARNGAKDLKSHHAGSDAVPAVVLEVTLRGRRFRIRRSPAWSRPSRRARSGHVDQHARATIEEQVGGCWVALSTRVDEVTLLVTRVLGMNRDQFCQVVMLPQGQFQTFLRAGAKERHDVLESLFDTRHFSRIETWLGDQRRAAENRLEAHRAAMCHLLARTQEVGGDVGNEIQEAIDNGDFHGARQRVAQLLEQTGAAAFRARQDENVTAGQLKEAQHALDSAGELAGAQASHRVARERLREMRAIGDVVAQRARRVSAALAARSLTPLVALVTEADDALDRARCEVVEALSAYHATVAATPVVLTPDGVDATVSAYRETLVRLEALVRVETAGERLSQRIAGTERELADLDGQRETQLAMASQLPGLLAEARAQLREQSDLAATAAVARARLAEAESRLVAAREVTRISVDVDSVARHITAAVEAQLSARAAWLDLRERRLHEMAAELAAQLAPGVACLVCGSPTHPSPARPSDSRVTAAVEAAALATSRARDEEHTQLLELAASLGAELAGASARADGLKVETAQRRVTRAAQQLDRAIEAQRVGATLAQQIDELGKRLQDLDKEANELDACRRLLRERRRVDTSELEAKRADLLRTVGAGSSVRDRVREIRAVVTAAVRLADAVHEQARRERTCADASSRFVTALAPTEFADVDDVRSAALTDADIAAAEALNRSHEADVRDATRLVQDPRLVAASTSPEPDIDALELRVERAEGLRATARVAAERLAGRRDRLEELLGQLEDAISRWHPLVERRDLTTAVAAMCAGTAADNVTKTRLSHYVLGARLEQVVAAANLRLAGIYCGRYQLEHSMERGVGDSRGGLGLVVVDTYTGQRRDPATLSGGETFYVSLALALGLADLVRDEAGGAELSTLFVDEGFGTLDTETLDEVLDEIDSLRSGGRCVGLVSHLSDLRMRIPTQLQVTTDQRGSTITAR